MSKNILEEKAKLVRSWCLRSTTEAGSGHPTSCLSAADLATVLFDTYYTYDIDDPHNPHNDRFVLSKGHAAPLFYTLYAMSGVMPLTDLFHLRKVDSPLEGHPTPNFPYTDAATGSLGQGLSVAAGMAYIGKKEQLGFNTYCLLGDGELAEGQVWEAANFASYYKLDNLIAIADINRLAQSDPTMFGHTVEEYMYRFSAFGFDTQVIDGHDIAAIEKAYATAKEKKHGKPHVIIAKTYKGKGVSFLEDQESWHGKALKKEELEAALKELGTIDETLGFVLKKPQGSHFMHHEEKETVSLQFDKEISTREVYGKVLAAMGDSDKAIYALDGDVKNSTYSMHFKKAHPGRFIECFIAEQNMASIAVGLSRLQKKPFVSTFAAFLTRSADQIRMAALSHANIAFCGSHAGVAIGEDGASQMGLEDISLFGTIPGTIILHPSDAVSTAKLLPLLRDHKGISYFRTLRSATPVLYASDEDFFIGGAKLLKHGDNDVLTVVATGITVHEALEAYEQLMRDGISVRIIDLYSIKPLDTRLLLQSLDATEKKMIITVEDHFTHGGMGDFVLDALSSTGATIRKLAVTNLSHSGKKDELLGDAGISAAHIVTAVKESL